MPPSKKVPKPSESTAVVVRPPDVIRHFEYDEETGRTCCVSRESRVGKGRAGKMKQVDEGVYPLVVQRLGHG